MFPANLNVVCMTRMKSVCASKPQSPVDSGLPRGSAVIKTSHQSAQIREKTFVLPRQRPPTTNIIIIIIIINISEWPKE